MKSVCVWGGGGDREDICFLFQKTNIWYYIGIGISILITIIIIIITINITNIIIIIITGWGDCQQYVVKAMTPSFKWPDIYKDNRL